tara:strand:- start:9160 stop:9861 length:702 start_codon:yes stop_codon:yes gene_type:complete
MPRKRTQKMYFGEEQEQAVVRFLESEDDNEKNKIFNEYLREPLKIMVESIIRRYKLYRKDYSFEQIHTDTLSFLMTKISKFDTTKNYKAYSYFGTICKNYLMGTIQKDQKLMNRSVSYEDISSRIEDRADLSYIIDEEIIDYKDVVNKLTVELEKFVEEENLNTNEQKLGYALVEVFTNFDKIFQVGEGNKFNKNLILLSLREMTSLSTKEIRVAMKKFKKLYEVLKLDFINY